jgi:hypothetical protein
MLTCGGPLWSSLPAPQCYCDQTDDSQIVVSLHNKSAVGTTPIRIECSVGYSEPVGLLRWSGQVSSVWLIPALGRRVPARAAIGYMLVYLSIVSGKAHPSHHPRNMLGLPHLCARAVPSAELRRHRAPGCASVLGSGQGCTAGRHLSCKSAHEPMIVGRDQRPRQGGEG